MSRLCRPVTRAGLRPRIHNTAAASLLLAAVVLFAVPATPLTVGAQEPAAPPANATTTTRTSPRRGAAAAAVAESRLPSGSIAGRVVGEDGRPLPGTTIHLTRRGAGLRSGQRIAAANANGDFRADDLDAGVYHLWVYAPGYIAAPESGATPEPRENRFYRVGDNVTLTMIKGGVITGRVVNTNDDPVVGVDVRAIYVRDHDGRAPHGDGDRPDGGGGRSETDDRGIYRIYGLAPGVYHVVTGGGGQSFGPPSGYENDVPTFYPSSTRDTAAEVTVQSGDETAGVDVRYRGERGHSVSGTISAPVEVEPTFGLSLILTHHPTGMIESRIYLQNTDRAFSFDGVADGDYDVSARRQSQRGEIIASPPSRITVRGADVTGLRLTLAPLAAISGRLNLEVMAQAERATPLCAAVPRRTAVPGETVIVARPVPAAATGRTASKDAPRSPLASRVDTTPNEQGEFNLRNLGAGHYQLEILPPGENWFVRAIRHTPPARGEGGGRNRRGDASSFSPPPSSSSPPVAAPPKPRAATAAHTAARSINNPVGRGLLALREGERVAGMEIDVAEGAAGIRGTVMVAAGDESRPPARLRVYLVPAGREEADEVRRYRVAEVSGRDNTFALSHIAPGRYWIVARRVADDEPTDAERHQSRQEAQLRTALRREAEAGGVVVDLEPCRRVADFALPYPPPAAR